jgi:release factor glutamine methyltransferase
MDETWTILKVIQWTTGFFSRKGIDQPRANAEVLLAHILGTERIQLYLRHDQPLGSSELSRYREAVSRRAAFEPTQYITGRQEFWSLEFEVGPAVLIPRPETELLVEKAIEMLRGTPARVLDIGTGSGAIAVALAVELKDLTVVATDRSPAALVIARRNAVRHKVENRVLFAAMDLFSAFSPATVPFDLIVSNPPYIGDLEFAALPREIAEHEPFAALRGGSDGLDIIRRILGQAPAFLKPGGSLLIEIGKGQDETIPSAIEHSRIDSCGFIRDYSGILRVIHCKANG